MELIPDWLQHVVVYSFTELDSISISAAAFQCFLSTCAWI